MQAISHSSRSRGSGRAARATLTASQAQHAARQRPQQGAPGVRRAKKQAARPAAGTARVLEPPGAPAA